MSPSHDFHHGVTALHEAAEGGFVETVQVLLSLGAVVDKQVYSDPTLVPLFPWGTCCHGTMYPQVPLVHIRCWILVSMCVLYTCPTHLR